MRLLIVDDEKKLLDFLKLSLEAEYFAVDVAQDGEKGSYMARTNDYDLLILDNLLPKKTGLEVCEEVRTKGKTMPILILSVKSEATSKIELLNVGADDYLTKPFSLEELLARIRALLRRPQQIEGDVLEIDDLMLDTRSCLVKRGAKSVYLTRKELQMEKHYDAKLPFLNIDPELMQIVFRNLLSNAVQYTFDGGTISFAIEKKRSNVLVSVSDNGAGIPEEAQSKIFTKLFRADNALAIDADGTGLGLYITRSIVEKFGGKIWFESKENKGTTFYVTIPLKQVKRNGNI